MGLRPTNGRFSRRCWLCRTGWKYVFAITCRTVEELSSQCPVVGTFKFGDIDFPVAAEHTGHLRYAVCAVSWSCGASRCHGGLSNRFSRLEFPFLFAMTSLVICWWCTVVLSCFLGYIVCRPHSLIRSSGSCRLLPLAVLPLSCVLHFCLDSFCHVGGCMYSAAHRRQPRTRGVSSCFEGAHSPYQGKWWKWCGDCDGGGCAKTELAYLRRFACESVLFSDTAKSTRVDSNESCPSLKRKMFVENLQTRNSPDGG